MIIKHIQSWNEFEMEIQTYLRMFHEARIDATPFDLIFRGHSDSNWHLDTTLERMIGKNVLLSRYFSMINSHQYEIETFADKKWDIPSQQEYEEWLKSLSPGGFVFPGWPFPAYEFMAYLSITAQCQTT